MPFLPPVSAQQFYKRMGDPTTESGRALLAERSPLNLADKIVHLLLIGQGARPARQCQRERPDCRRRASQEHSRHLHTVPG